MTAGSLPTLERGIDLAAPSPAAAWARKSVLIVTTAFAPENAIGAVRVSKLAKYLVRQGHAVSVISRELEPGTPLDPSLECDEFDALRRHTVPQSTWFRRAFVRRRKLLLAQRTASSLLAGSGGPGLLERVKVHAVRYLHFAYTMVRNYDWQRQVLRFTRAHPELGRFDVVVSSYPSLGAMWAARTIRRQGTAGSWIAEFRDRLNYRTSTTPILYGLNTLIQNRLLSRADHVLGVSAGVVARLSPRYARKYRVLTGGYDLDDLALLAGNSAPEQREAVLTLCYTGSLYGGERDVSVVFGALERLQKEGAIPPKGVSFVYAGKEFGVLSKQARSTGMEGILVDGGYVGRAQALRLQQQADIAMIVTWNTATELGILSGKLFECFLLRKPILGVVNGTQAGSEIRQVVERLDAGFVYESATPAPREDFHRLCDFLRDAYAEKIRHGSVHSRYNEAVQEFSYDNIASRLSEIF